MEGNRDWLDELARVFTPIGVAATAIWGIVRRINARKKAAPPVNGAGVIDAVTKRVGQDDAAIQDWREAYLELLDKHEHRIGQLLAELAVAKAELEICRSLATTKDHARFTGESSSVD